MVNGINCTTCKNTWTTITCMKQYFDRPAIVAYNDKLLNQLHITRQELVKTSLKLDALNFLIPQRNESNYSFISP